MVRDHQAEVRSVQLARKPRLVDAEGGLGSEREGGGEADVSSDIVEAAAIPALDGDGEAVISMVDTT